MEEILSAPIYAAIDVGSNTIHVVVARCLPSTLKILADEVEMVRIGESVNASGTISHEKTLASIKTLQSYRSLAEKLGAKQIFVVATEAIRQAKNSSEFIERVRAETGLEIALISGTAEANLTFLGATYATEGVQHAGVMDLGGGSMELVFATFSHIEWRTSLPIGSGWLHDHYLSNDPPGPDEIKAAKHFLRSSFRQSHLPEQPLSRLIVTGGSANSLLHLTHHAFHRDDTSTHLSFEDLIRCQHLLSSLEANDIAKLFKAPPARARIMLAGALIIKHVMQYFHLSEILVSPHGIREGVLLAHARYGKQWLNEVDHEEPVDSFAQSAHKTLLVHLNNLLEWLPAVLKHEDIEAVHKMRVASRRLRATLDAYQSCCDPVLFARIYRTVKKTANLLGEARDVDVQLAYLNEQLTHLNETDAAGVRWLIVQLQTFRQTKQHELEAFLQKLDGKELTRQLKKCVLKGAKI